MRLRFIGAPHLTEYHRPGAVSVHFKPGEEQEIPDDAARELLVSFPGLFVAVSSDIASPVVDRQIKEPVRRKRA
jgi:hypothetical protein